MRSTKKHKRNTAIMFAFYLVSLGWYSISANAEETLISKEAPPEQVIPAEPKVPKQTFYPVLTKAELRIEQELQKQTEANFPEVPLWETMAYFSDLHNVSIQIQQKDLGDYGITPDTLIKASLKELSLKSALTQILEPLDLTYVVDRDLLLITTTDKAAYMMKPRVYPVGDLCSTEHDYQTLSDAIRNSSLGDWRSEIPYQVPGGLGANPERQRYANTLGGTISVVPQTQSLVISQTYHAHTAIVDLLTQLRLAKAEQ